MRFVKGHRREDCGLTAAGMATLQRQAHPSDARVGQRLTADTRASRRVLLEEGFPEATAAGLKQRGHAVVADVGGDARAVFGRGQIIRRDPHSGVLWGGSDPRADGQVLGW
jgi:gamma-glutamyltranspeptidase